jgi:transpeptidase family protein
VPPSRARATRIAIALAVVAAAAGGALLLRNARHDQGLAEGRRLLAEGDFAGAAERFDGLTDSGRVGTRARAGLAVARAAGDDATSATFAGADEARSTIDAAGVPIRPIAEAALRAGRHHSAIALGRLLAAAGDAEGAAYEAAALVEMGRDEQARALAASRPEAFGGGLGAEVAAVLDVLSRGGVTIVRDRAGRLLGGATASGALVPAAGIAPEWIPRRALLPLTRAGGDAPVPGIRLALDLERTKMAAEALAGRRGTIVLLDPVSGALLAAVSDAATFAAGGTPAFDQQREPASIQKLVTTTAAMRAGLDPDAEIARMTCGGWARYGSGSLWCPYPGGKLSGLGHALAISCNVAFANLGVKVGRAALVAELRRYGFDSDAPGAGHVTQPEGDERQLADLSVGLTATEITPVHAARMAAVFATGMMPDVALVSADDGRMGLTPEPTPLAHDREGARDPQVIDPSWVPVLQKAMEPVTGRGGTAEGVEPASFPVVMKTGTASEPGLGYHTNYIGIGPMPDPDVAYCVRVTHGPSSPVVTRSAREALAGLLERLGRARR